VHRCHYRFPPEPAQRHHRLEHASRHAHDRLISSLHDAILFWRVWCGQVLLNPHLGAVVEEGLCRELTTIVRVERAKLSLSFSFCPHLELHERRHGLILGPQLTPVSLARCQRSRTPPTGRPHRHPPHAQHVLARRTSFCIHEPNAHASCSNDIHHRDRQRFCHARGHDLAHACRPTTTPRSIDQCCHHQ
jgi:hypothetical protein